MMINKSWAVTLVPLVLGLVAAIGDQHPQFGHLVNEQTVMALLGAFGVTAGIGATKSIKKKSQQIQEAKAIQDGETKRREIDLEHKKLEQEKADSENKKQVELENIKIDKEIELAKLDLEKAKIEAQKEIAKVPTPQKEIATKLLTPDQYADLSPTEQDNFVKSGGIVTTRIKSKGEKTWSNQGGWFDSTLINDPDKGAVIRDSTQYLWFKVHDASNFTVVIREDDDKKKVVQLEQSQTGIARIEADQFPIGKYTYQISATGRGTSYSVGAEGKFQVIAD